MTRKMSEMRPRIALCFGCDETFMPLAKGLVLSLRSAGFEDDLFFIDIGVSDHARTWLAGQGAKVLAVDPAELVPGYLPNGKIAYTAAMVSRPFIPQLIPGYDVYVWLDSDTWLQNGATLRSFIAAASTGAGKIAISATDPWVYGLQPEQVSEYAGYSKGWYSALYGSALGVTYAERKILNAGFFALAGNSPVWHAWRREIALIFSDPVKMARMNIFEIHMAEQTALNYVCYSRDCFVEFTSFHNYNCHFGSVERRDGEVRRVGDGENRIGLVHLTNFSRLARHYCDSGLLYEGGAYLSDAERMTLSRLAPLM